MQPKGKFKGKGTQKDGKNKVTLKCFKCGNLGHRASECQKPDDEMKVGLIVNEKDNYGWVMGIAEEKHVGMIMDDLDLSG